MLDEIWTVNAGQGRIAEDIEDLKKSLKKTVEEEVRTHKNFLEVGCLGTILWIFGRLNYQEWMNSIYWFLLFFF